MKNRLLEIAIALNDGIISEEEAILRLVTMLDTAAMRCAKCNANYFNMGVPYCYEDFCNQKPLPENNDAMALFSATQLKTELLEHLRTKYVKDVTQLWGESKSYYKERLINMGGSYASWQDFIGVHLYISGNQYRFEVSIAEANTPPLLQTKYPNK